MYGFTCRYPSIRTVARIRTFVKGLRGFLQGYNAQAVTNEHQVVLAAEIETVGADFGHLEPMLDVTHASCRGDVAAHEPRKLVSDRP